MAEFDLQVPTEPASAPPTQAPSLDEVVRQRVQAEKARPPVNIDPFFAERAARDQKVNDARTSVSTNIDKDPDEFARYQRLSRQTGLDPVMLMEDADVRKDAESRAKLGKIDFDTLIRTNPKTVSFMTNPQNAALMYDDTESLSALEMAYEGVNKAFKVVRGFAAGLGPETAKGMYGLAAIPFGVANTLIERPISAWAEYSKASLESNPVQTFPLRFAASIADMNMAGRAEAGLLALGEESARAGAAVSGRTGRESVIDSGIISGGQSLGQFTGVALSSIRRGGLRAGAEASKKLVDDLGALVAGTEYGEAREKADPLRAAFFAGLQRQAEIVTERLPVKALLGDDIFKKGLLKAFVNFQVKEGGTEQINAAWQDFNEWAVLNQGKPIGAYLAERPNVALQTAIATTIAGGGQIGAVKLMDRFSSNNVQDTRAFFDALSKGVTDSKLHKRLPEKTREFIKELTAEGDIKNVYIEAGQFTSYMQSKGLDPTQAIVEVLGPDGAKQLAEAEATGGDLVIPLEAYSEKIAGSEHHQGLADDLRLRQGDLSFRQSKIAENEAAKDQVTADTLVKDAIRVAQEEQATQPIYDDVYARALAAGAPPSQADTWAAIEANRYRARAARLNTNPMDLWNREGGLEIAREGVPMAAPSTVTTLNQADVSAPAFKSWFGESKVVNEEGEPLVVYHGTASDFSEFDIAKGGSVTGGVNTGLGFFFSNDPKMAAVFAKMAAANDRAKGIMQGAVPAQTPASGNNVMPVYLSMSNPLVIQARNMSDADKMMLEQLKPEHDGAIVEMGPNNRAYMVRNPNQIKSAVGNRGTYDPASDNILYQKERGMVQMNDAFRRITLLKDADPSTFIHELGHTWLEELRRDANTDGAPQELVDDWNAVREWLGLAPDEAISVKAHEQFARGIEAYFMEGNAPSVVLRRVFSKVKAWMLSVYQDMRQLDVKLNKDIRAVFDRMLALDEEIDRARALNGYVQMFSTPEAAGMTEAEFKVYSASTADAIREGQEKLTQSVANELAREQSAEWRTNRKAIRDTVAEEVKKDKTYQAIWFLSRGEFLDGGKPDIAVKLDKAGLIAIVGEDKLKDLTPAKLKTAGWIYSATGGVSPDFVAKMFGFRNGAKMIDAIVNKTPMNTFIDSEADRLMRAEYGDPLDPAELVDKAELMVHSDRQADLLAVELNALRRKKAEYDKINRTLTAAETRENRERRRAMMAPVPVAVLKEVAFNEISSTRVEDLDPRKYLYAEVRSAKLAMELAAKGDYEGAADAKQRQILNFYMHTTAANAKNEVDAIVKRTYRLTREASRKRIGKAGQEWLQQLDSILNRYGFATREVVKQRSVGDWLKSVEETTGEVVATTADVVNEANVVNYKELTVDELRAVNDTILSIEHVAKKLTQVTRNGVAFETKEIVDQLVTSVKTNVAMNPMPETDKAITEAGRVSRVTNGFFNSNLRPEKIFERLDGGKSGVWHDMFWNESVDAQNYRDDLRVLVMGPLVEFNEKMPAEQKERMNEGVEITSLDRTISRRTAIGIALNSGNASNQRKMQEGGMWFGDKFTKISDANLAEILGKLDKNDWDLVQSLWDSVDKLYPYLNDLNQRAVGIPLDRVKATPVNTRFGVYNGGYWPAVADPRHSKVGEQQENSDTLISDTFGHRYPRAATSNSFRQERTEAVYPLQLDWERVLSSHVNKAITDIAYHEWVKQARRFLENQAVKKSLQNTIGEEVYRSLNEWLVHQVAPIHGGYSANQSVTTLTNTLLSNTVVAALGFKAATAIGNFVVAPVQASHQIRPDYTVRGIAKFLRNPFKAINAVHSMSGEMRHRFEHYEQTFNIVMADLEGKSTIRANIARWAMAVHLYVDKVTSTALWTGKYQQEIDGGKTPEEAGRLADKMIRTTQTAGAPKDLSSFERDPQYRIFKMFIGPMIIMQNEMRGSVAGKGARALISPEVWATMFATWIIPAVLFELAVGRGPEDDEEFYEWAMRKIALYPAQTVPFVRDAAGAVESVFTGREMMTRSNPISDTLITLVRQTDKALAEDAEMGDITKAFARGAGLLFGLPTGQAVITGEFLSDVSSGEFEPEGIEDLRYLLYRREE